MILNLNQNKNNQGRHGEISSKERLNYQKQNQRKFKENFSIYHDLMNTDENGIVIDEKTRYSQRISSNGFTAKCIHTVVLEDRPS